MTRKKVVTLQENLTNGTKNLVYALVPGREEKSIIDIAKTVVVAGIEVHISPIYNEVWFVQVAHVKKQVKTKL